MAKHPNARPVSGEIMASRRSAQLHRFAKQSPDVFDAEFETLAHFVPDRPLEPVQGRIGEHPATTGFGILSKSGSPAARLFATQGGAAFWCAGLALIAAAFWISGGHVLLTDNDKNRTHAVASDMKLDDVVSRVDFSGAKPVIFVDGHVSNDGAHSQNIPGLEIRVSDLHGLTTRYKLGTSSQSLAAGEQYAFSSRLDVPKNGVRTVAVAFAE